MTSGNGDAYTPQQISFVDELRQRIEWIDQRLASDLDVRRADAAERLQLRSEVSRLRAECERLADLVGRLDRHLGQQFGEILAAIGRLAPEKAL